ncbi:hypothetical protein [Acinetobacter bereziniae]|uniref:hypothetical protein n=1 Tax=Acinetobacter bereziniae TaxID=106648 RepID=UPI003AF857DA
MEKQKNRPSVGILGALLPGTMSSVAKNKEDASVLKNRQGMSNIGTIGAAIATSPYAVSVGSGSFGAGAKAPIMGAVGSAAVDGGFQTFDSVRCKCNAYNYKRTLGVASVGALTGGANLAKASGVECVTAMNFYKNTANTIGEKIFYGQTVVKSITTKPIKEKPSLKLNEPKYSK